MTDVAKAAVRAFHGRGADRAYFDGCSTGGQQGLTEAQRFPADYDGIVAGDPGHNRVRLILGFLWGWLALHDNAGKPLLPAAKLPMITSAACRTGADDVDNWIADPSSCRFDPATVACRGDDNESCLTPAQVDAVRKVYQGARNPRTGEQIFPGWARGTEQGWGSYLLNPPEPVRVGMMRSLGFDNPTWDFRTFDWDRDVARVDARMAPLAATSTDLRAFRARGGKLLMYTGLADPVTPPADTVGYVDAVTRTMGGRPETDAFLRFFPVPGMGHCMGGPGLTSFDALSALDAWVSGDAAPDQLVATRPDNVLPASSRPLCAYPSVARRRAGAPPDRAESYRCEPAR
jgi:feruloyl esterase